MGSTKVLKKRVIGVLLTLIMLLQIVFPTLSAYAAEGLTDIQFTDKNLYNKVKKELEAKTDLSTLYCNDDELMIQVANEDIARITELNLQGSTNVNEDVVKSLTGLEAFTGLQKLHLAQNKLTSDANLGALNGLTNLIELDLSENHIEDVSSISNLTEASKNGKLMLKLTGQTINYIEIINKLPDDEEFNKTTKVRLPQIFDYAYSKGETVNVSGSNAIRYVENGELYLEIGRDIPLREETQVGNVPKVVISVTETADGQEGSTFNTVCNFKYIVIDGENFEGIIFHEEGNLYYGVKEEIQNTYGIGKNKEGKDYSEIISSSNKYFDDEKVMVINKIDLLNDITKLDVSGKGVHYLKGINHFAALQDLILEDNYIQDVTLLKSLVENKTTKANEIATILQSKITDFNAEYNKLVDVFTKYEAAMQRKYELEKALRNDEAGEKYAEYSRELEQIEINIANYKKQKIEHTNSTISKLNNINECLSLDEIIGFDKNIEELKEIIEKLQNGGFTSEELEETKNNLSTIYSFVTERIKSLSREELGYLTVDEFKAYLNNKVNELSVQELREVVGTYGKTPNTVEFEIKLPKAAYEVFEVELDPCDEIDDLGLLPNVKTDYNFAYESKEGVYKIYCIEAGSGKELPKDTVVGTVSYSIPNELKGKTLTLNVPGVIRKSNGDAENVDFIVSTSRTSGSSSVDGIDLENETREKLLEIITGNINDTSITEVALKQIEAIINVTEIKYQELSNIEYYDEHEILYEIRNYIENKDIDILKAFATVNGINLDNVPNNLYDIKLFIIETLETYSRDNLIRILKEEKLKDRLSNSLSDHEKTGTYLIRALANNNEGVRLIDLVEEEVEISQKYALIDAIMKEVKEYKLGKEETKKDSEENAITIYYPDDLDDFLTIMDDNDFYVETTKINDDGKEQRLSEQEVKNNIQKVLVDKADISELKDLLNDLINEDDRTLATRYITSEIDDARLYDMTLDFAYPVIDEEGNTKQVTLLDRIAEKLNEEIKYISEFDSVSTLNAANTLLNHIEPVQSKIRYLYTYLNSIYIKGLDENQMSSVKTKLDRVAARLNTDNLKELSKLEVLNLAQNEMLINVEPLSSLTTLKIFNLANDYMIDDIEKLNINSFADLEILNLSGIGLANVNIAGLKKLRCLDLSYNYFENIDNVQIIGDGENAPFYTDNLNNLIHLDLSGNNIANIANIENELNNLTRYQSSGEMGMVLPFDMNRDLMLYSQDLSIDLKVTNKSSNKIIELPMIYRQIENIQGITVSFRGNTNNSGREVAIPTHKLGNFTELAEIIGGIGAGTTYTINYIVQDKDEAAKIPVSNIVIQEEIVLDDENAIMPDLTEDKKVTTADVDKIVEYIGKTEFPAVADVVPDGIINDSDYKLLKEYVKEGWNSDDLTLEQRQKASEADINKDNNVDNKDLEILALHILNITSNSETSIADINADGVIDIKDSNMLSKYIVSKSTERRNTDVVTLAILNEYKETKQLHANVMPENATDKRVTWTSNNENYVRVDETGKITAVGEGTTTINVASVSDTNVFKTIRVDVVKAENIVEEINIVEPKEGETGIKTDYYVGEELDLTNAKLEAKRRDGTKEIVDITKEMLEGFTTEEEGEKLVTVTYEGKQTSFTVKVTEYTEPKVDITKDNLAVKLPENVTYDGQEHLAEVALKEGVKAGELTIRYEIASDDETASNVVVEKPVNAGTYKVIAEITDSIYANAATIEVGTFTIAQAELPTEARPVIDTEYTVEKGGSFGVTVKDGIISAPEGTSFDEVGIYNIELTYTPNDTNYAEIKIPVKVNVVVSVTGVNLDKSEYTIVKGGETHLVATVMPEDATNKNVTWVSSDENVAKVEDGKVTAIGVGEAIITVITRDGEKSTTCRIIVKEQVYEAKELNGGVIAITGINPETTEEYFRDKFLSENNYKLFKEDGKTELTKEDKIGTGYRLKVYDTNGTVVEEQVLVVKGDTNGDGKASATDSGAILAHRTGEKALSNEYLLAADINNDGTVDGRDSTLLIYHRIGMAGYILQNN